MDILLHSYGNNWGQINTRLLLSSDQAKEELGQKVVVKLLLKYEIF